MEEHKIDDQTETLLAKIHYRAPKLESFGKIATQTRGSGGKDMDAGGTKLKK